MSWTDPPRSFFSHMSRVVQSVIVPSPLSWNPVVHAQAPLSAESMMPSKLVSAASMQVE